MTSAVPGILRQDARPPIEMDAAPAPGPAAVRSTVVPRRMIAPFLFDREAFGHAPDDPAVRRFWTAVVGPGAVADLLRLIAAARSGRRLREPTHLGVLATEGLIVRNGDMVLVRPAIPHLAGRHQKLLAPALRTEYRRLLAG
jgi:hypothetical protein